MFDISLSRVGYYVRKGVVRKKIGSNRWGYYPKEAADDLKTAIRTRDQRVTLADLAERRQSQ